MKKIKPASQKTAVSAYRGLGKGVREDKKAFSAVHGIASGGRRWFQFFIFFPGTATKLTLDGKVMCYIMLKTGNIETGNR